MTPDTHESMKTFSAFLQYLSIEAQATDRKASRVLARMSESVIGADKTNHQAIHFLRLPETEKLNTFQVCLLQHISRPLLTNLTCPN